MNIAEVTQEILHRLDNRINLATPLGLGKPNVLLNSLYKAAVDNPKVSLTINTALSLNPPLPTEDLALRFFKPFADRQWGADYPHLEYAKDAEKNKLPTNVKVHEFYFRAGSALASESLQKNYQSINYTHVAEAVYNADINLVVQMIAKEPGVANPRYSLSCNPDVTLDLHDLYVQGNKPLMKVGVVHPDLPFLGGESVVGSDFFDFIVDEGAPTYQLFALPRTPIDETDHAIGFYASQLVADNGTLQIGIGSLSDAVVSSLLIRHQKNDLYLKLFDQAWKNKKPSARLLLETKPFNQGIYGLSEMVTDGYMHMRKAGILKRQVVDEKSGMQTFLHGAFYLGSKEFYSWLRNLKDDEFTGLRMTRVSKVNDLYDPNEILLRQQRINGRFLNTCMQVSLLGGAASETLKNGKVISGVGGQYNFISMAAELKNARSVLMLRSTRESRGKRSSNVVWSHAHLTIPRHLRDLVVTEYGIADLRNKTDEECMCALIEISDSEFQPNLIEMAKKNGKISRDFQVSERARNNTPAAIKKFISEGRRDGVFSPFAMGSDFTPEEEKLALALSWLQSATAQKGVGAQFQLLGYLLSGLQTDSKIYSRELKRMKLDQPTTLVQKIERALLLRALNETRS